MVRPRSVSWGTEREAQIANRQAFFWTNTAPQSWRMNLGWWLQLEQWEEQIVIRRGKTSGFAGPVFAANDPVIGEVERKVGRLRVRENLQQPRKFWKVVAVAGARRRLETAAFLVDERALTRQRSPFHVDPATFRTSVAEIEAETGLDFGDKVRNARSISVKEYPPAMHA